MDVKGNMNRDYPYFLVPVFKASHIAPKVIIRGLVKDSGKVMGREYCANIGG